MNRPFHVEGTGLRVRRLRDPDAAFVLPAVAARTAAGAGQRLATATAALRVAALDAISGLREVRAFGAGGRMLALVQAREAALLDAQSEVSVRGARAGAAALKNAEKVL